MLCPLPSNSPISSGMFVLSLLPLVYVRIGEVIAEIIIPQDLSGLTQGHLGRCGRKTEQKVEHWQLDAFY